MNLLIKEMRKQAGFTQRDLAKKLGVEWRTYGAWERGENAINVEQLCRICDALGCTPNDLLGWKKPTQEDPAEQALLDAYRDSDPDKRRILQGMTNLLTGGLANPSTTT